MVFRGMSIFRRLFVLGLVVAIISMLAALVALQASTEDAEAQVAAYPMDTLCLNRYTGSYKGSLYGACPPNHLLVKLPDAYPLTLCGSAWNGSVRTTQPGGTCLPGASVVIELPSLEPVTLCYNRYTAGLRLPYPYPGGACTPTELLVSLPLGLITNPDTYQTLGNVDIDVPVDAGVLANDSGDGINVSAFDAVSANGGTVVMNPDGSFTYTPPAPSPNAFIGVDSFSYTAMEAIGGTTEDVQVTIEVRSPVVWFVDADAGDPGDGRRMTPLNNINVLNNDGSDPDNPGDFIFLYESSSIYDAAFFLEEGQSLIGQEVDLLGVLAACDRGDDTARLQCEHAAAAHRLARDRSDLGHSGGRQRGRPT